MQQKVLFRFNPDMYSHEALESIFVQRHELAEKLIEDVRESALTDAKHYNLLIGARGLGKTHLVAIVYHRLKDIEELQRRLVIAWTREEEWGVTSYLDLIMQVLKALVRERADEGLQGRVQQITDQFSGDREASAREAEDLLREYVGQRTLLMIFENLHDLFGAIGEEGQQNLRAYLQNNGFCTIIATAQSLFHGVSDRALPFHGFFAVRHLHELNVSEAAELLAKIADMKDSKDLAAFIRTPTGRQRVQAIHHLAGGNHRIYVTLSELLTRQSLDELSGAFLEMLDELTPFFQSRMQYLSAQQRKIVETLCERGHPLAVQEIAQAAFATPQTTSAQLKELRRMHYVRSKSIGRQSFYELQEPLMRLCHQRNADRGRPIVLFVELLRLWYTRDELRERMQMAEAQGLADREYLVEALKPAAPSADAAIFEACSEEIQDAIAKGNWAAVEKAAAELVQTRGSARDWMLLGTGELAQGKDDEAVEAFDKALAIDPEDAFAWNMRGYALARLGRYEEAIAAFDRALAIDPEHAAAWNMRGYALGRLGRYEEAIEGFDKALTIDPKHADAWHNRGCVLDELGRYDEAIEAYNSALDIDPEHAGVWYNRGNALVRVSRYEDAIEAYNRALDIAPENVGAWNNRGYALDELGRYEDAIEVYDRALHIDRKNGCAWNNRAVALGKLGRYGEAIESLDEALAIDPERASAWYNRGEALRRLGRYEEARESLRKALEHDADRDPWGIADLCLRIGRIDESMEALEHALKTAREGKKAPESIAPFIGSVLMTEVPQERWKAVVSQWLRLFGEYGMLWHLAMDLLRSIETVVKPEVSDHTAEAFRDVWQAAGAELPELEVALRLLDVAVQWKTAETDKDRERSLLKLPAEERKLLLPLLGLGEEDGPMG